MLEFLDKPNVRRAMILATFPVGSLLGLGIYQIMERDPVVLQQRLELDKQTLNDIKDAKDQITRTGRYNGTIVENPSAVFQKFNSRRAVIEKDMERIDKISRKNARSTHQPR